MPNIIFKKNFEVKKEFFLFDEIKKFPFANEFYTAINVEEEEFSENFIKSILKKKNLKKVYKSLSSEEKISAKELLVSILQFTPEFFSCEMEEILEENILDDLKEIKKKREKALEESGYFNLSRENVYFSRIIDGEPVRLEEDFLADKNYEIIK